MPDVVLGIFDSLLTRLSANQRSRRCLIPLLRAYIRYAPFAAGKAWLWSRVINPHFAWTHHRFVCKAQSAGRIAGNTHDILQQYLYYFGVWEPNLTSWIVGRLRPGDTFVDLGANIGYYSLLASKLVGRAGSVVAIEASPGIFHQLEGNLRLNQRVQESSLSLREGAGVRGDGVQEQVKVRSVSIGNVRPINIAVSDRDGLTKFFRGPDANSGLSTIVADEAAPHDCQFECEIATAPLASLVTSDEIRTARLIKIDVEGAEWPVVIGMLPLLSATRPVLEIMVEICPARLARQGRSPAELLALFQAAGFHAYTIENDYRAESYLARRATKPPMRLRTPIEHEVDLIFSRTDAEAL